MRENNIINYNLIVEYDFFLNIRKKLEKAPFYGTFMKKNNFGDIITISKGKLRKINQETIVFQQTNDYENDSITEDILALYLVEKVRHHDLNHGYQYDLRFTIIPFGRYTKNIDSLRKRIFILRDIDYPEYFSAPQIPQKIGMRSDIISTASQRLNYGEFQKRRPETYHNRNQRFPVRFPESHEALPHPIAHKSPHVFYQLDHRGSVSDLNKNQEKNYNKHSFYLSPIALPMYSIPMFNNNQRSLSMPFRNKQNLVLAKKSIYNENVGVNSIRVNNIIPLNDRKLNESISNTKHDSKTLIKYSLKLSDDMDLNNHFKPIIPPFQYMRRVVATKTTTSTTTPTTSSIHNLKPSSTSTVASIEKSPRSRKRNKNYDIVATRSSFINSNSTIERPVLKWYPKKHRNRGSLLTTSTIHPTTQIVEMTPTIINNSSTRSLFFRGRNRFMLDNEKKNRNEATTTEKSLLSSKWKAITTTKLPTTEYAMRENESNLSIKSQNNNDFVELVSGNVEEVESNSTNIDIFKATEIETNPTIESTTLSKE